MSAGVCTACELHGPHCHLTFVCTTCQTRKNTCLHKVGGFEGAEDVCSSCHFERVTGLRVTKYGLREARPRRTDACTDMAS